MIVFFWTVLIYFILQFFAGIALISTYDSKAKVVFSTVLRMIELALIVYSIIHIVRLS